MSSRDHPQKGRSVQNRLVSVQILRGIAALLVAWCHLTLARSNYWHSRHVWDFGAIGVDIFFIISGFVMALTMEKYREKSFTFLWHRYLRIAPLYYLLGLQWALVLWIGRYPVSWASIVSNITILPLGSRYTAPVLEVGWTLSFEFVFYGLVCLSLALRKGPGLLFAMLSILASVGTVYVAPVPVLRWLTHPVLFEFALGVLAFMLRHQRIPQWLAWAGLIVLIVEALLPVPFDPGWPALIRGEGTLYRLALWAIPAFLAFNGVIRWEPKGPLVKPAQLLGDSSYSIYLSHSFVAVMLASFVPPPIGFGLVIVVGVACYRWIELPLLGLKKWRRLTGRGPLSCIDSNSTPCDIAALKVIDANCVNIRRAGRENAKNTSCNV